LTLASGWFTVACLVEAVFRWSALAAGLALPDVGVLRASHAMALFGGVIGWVMGVLLRAGPMFVASWHVPLAAIRVAPLTLTAGVLAIALGEATVWTPAIAAGVARLGELIVLSTFAAVVVMSGALRRRGTALPMVARSAAEARIFRIALGSVGAALIGAALAAAAALGGQPDHLLTDVVRHLITIGVLTSVVTAMAFRLIPVLEGRPLPYPRLRAVAFWALLSAVVLRSAELLVGHGWSGRAAWVPLSGVLVWVALAAVAINLAVTIAGASRARSAGTAPGDPSGPPV
jgi:hypothetical protein